MSNLRRMGLPDALRMRHDTHFVDQLARPGTKPVGRLLPIEEIDANPNQPRRSLDDLVELTASIREKGVLEPIIVRPLGRRYQIVAGERRYRAAVEAGLDEIPAVIRECSDAETMEIALIENLQRRDLSPFEEADGLKTLAETYGYTHETMAERIGKSRTSITETLSLHGMPDQVRQLCRLADIRSKSTLLQIVRQGSTERMIGLIEQLQKQGLTRAEARRITKHVKTRGSKVRPRPYTFHFQPKEKSFTLALRFKKSQIARDEIVRSLQAVIEALTREE